jgi:hypothetical protein
MARTAEENPEATETDETVPLRDDLIIGMRAIAAELGVSRRKASYWHERHAIPTFRMAGSVCMRRSEAKAVLRARPLPTEGE